MDMIQTSICNQILFWIRLIQDRIWSLEDNNSKSNLKYLDQTGLREHQIMTESSQKHLKNNIINNK